jgi:hypothetical protein
MAQGARSRRLNPKGVPEGVPDTIKGAPTTTAGDRKWRTKVQSKIGANHGRRNFKA